jgi:hypothetical protein
VYILSDDPNVHALLLQDDALRHNLVQLFQIPTLRTVEMDRNSLWAHCTYRKSVHGKGTDAEIAQRAAAEVVPLLAPVCVRLGDPNRSLWRESDDPLRRMYPRLHATSIAVGAAGFLTLLAAPGPSLPFALTRGHILAHAHKIAALLLLLMIAGALWKLGRSSRTHLLLASILLIATPGVWFAATVVLERYNNSASLGAAEHATSFHHRHESTSSRRNRRKSYHVEFTRMPAPVSRYRLRVDAATYARLPPGQCVSLRIHEGALGDLWLSDITPIPCEASP